ncbi:hypothetical protein V7x_00630 [Crateriforma conspicua]|uniref:Uncharacterized protein n=2 Tax=Crateriforma conspicua TaxID=2527996 RepID=A0A5C6FNH9_9PLAN|nr:hypothetical protein V7x_00630 [Crateriforma conspicua]
MVKRIRLQHRDHAILRHIARYRMTTAETLHEMFFAGKGADAVTSTLRRLREADYVCSSDLAPPRRCYYRLTARATRAIGVAPSLSRPLGEQALPIRYAVLRHCSKSKRQFLTADEFCSEFSECVATGLPNEPYCLHDDGESPGLVFLLVDLGADVGRIVRKCRKALGERKRILGFRDLIEGKAFSVNVLTARDEKRVALQTALERDNSITDAVSVSVVNDFVGLI